MEPSWAPLISCSAASVTVLAVGARRVPRRRATWASDRQSLAALIVGNVRQTWRPACAS
jgi:hypothetical protein